MEKESNSTLLFPLERIFIFSHSLHILRPHYPSEITLRDSWNKSDATSKKWKFNDKKFSSEKTFLISLMRWLYLPTRFHPTRPDGAQLWAWNIIDAKSIHRLLPLTCSKCKCSSFWIFLLWKKQIFSKLNQISGKNTEDLKIKTRGFSKQKYYRSCY